MNSTNSTFKMPLLPIPHTPSETLLFNDILEEKTQTLRNTMNEFLQVQPYRKFDEEFSNFLKRIKQIMLEGQRNGANISRLTNTSHISAIYSRPSSTFNYRPSTTMSTVNLNRNSTLRLQENNFQPIAQLNPFKPPVKPVVLLSRIDQSFHTSQRSSSFTTDCEINQLENETEKTTNNNNGISQYCELTKPSEKSQATNIPNSYSDITIIENNSIENNLDASAQQIENNDDNDDSNAVESLMENFGFKITVGLPRNTKTNTQLSDKTVQIDEKFLSKWSLNMKKINSLNSLLLTGTLLEQDQVTVKEKNHDAGILISRKAKDIIRTNNGIYHLVGNIIGGSPNELYQTCLALHGIPRSWKKDFKLLNTKNNKNAINFSLNSPSGPLKPTKFVNDHDVSMTRNGKTYSEYSGNIKIVNHKTHGKRKSSENDTNNQRKQRKVHEQPPLLASTPKRTKLQMNVFTPSEMLKDKICQNIHNQTKAKPNIRSLKNANNSIEFIKKRPFNSKAQATILEESTKSINGRSSSKNSNASEKNSKLLMETIITSCVNDLKKSKQMSINISSNCSSKKKWSENLPLTDNSNHQCNLKTSVNSTKNSGMNSTTNSKQMSPTKCTKSVRQNKNINHVPSSEVLNKNKKTKTIKEKTKTVKENTKNCSKKLNNVSEQKKLNKKLVPCSSAELGIFGDVDFSEYGIDEEYNMMSPSKMSILSSHSNKSRSMTPPLVLALRNKSMPISEPPTPLSKSADAKALKRVKAPKITVEEELKNTKKLIKKEVDYKAATKKLNKMLEYGTDFNNSDDE